MGYIYNPSQGVITRASKWLDRIKIDYLATKERQHLAGKRRLSGVRGARNQAVLNAGAFIESLDAGVPLVKHIFVRLLN